MKAFILTAGLGNRLKPLTDKIPKPLLKVGGKPIVWYAENLLKQHGITDICVNVHHHPQQIVEYFGDRVLYSFEPELLGTAGALTKVKDWLSDPFVVLNGDTISDVDLTFMLNYHRLSKLATVFTKDTATHNGGAFIFNREVFSYIPDSRPYSIHEDLIPDLAKKNAPVTLYKSNANYFDLGTHEKLAKARKFFNNEKTARMS